ncbi:MAG: hypothetical protein H7210_14300 [Pyrinomonadaceae bacterium]|nr:hypothetical protein [Phycisphaerales bacterium]
MPPSADDILHFARFILRTNYEGSLALAERASAVRFIRDGKTGRLIAPVEGWMLQQDSGTLVIEQEGSDALELLVELVEVSADAEAACDRWLAHHESSAQRKWCAMTIGGARLGRQVLDPEDITPINPVHDQEPRLCKLANADRTAFRLGCERAWTKELPESLCVGVDPTGFDIRTRVGMTRLEFGAVGMGLALVPEGLQRGAEDIAEIIDAILGLGQDKDA